MWVELMMYGSREALADDRRIAHQQLKQAVGRVSCRGRALVVPSRPGTDLPVEVSTLLVWRASQDLAAFLATACDAEFAADGARGSWHALVVDVPAHVRAPLPPGWHLLGGADGDDVVETATVLIGDGMPAGRALSAARALVG